jgi:hypothetical protein
MIGSLHALLVVGALGTPAEPADLDAARRAVERAKVHVAAGEYEHASVALAEAFALDPDPAYLYARAQAERFGGDCATAVGLYRAFLAEDPPEEDRALAQRHIRACEGAGRNEAVASPEPPPPRPTALPEAPEATVEAGPPTTPERARGARPWFVDPAGGALVGTGLVGVAVGLGLAGHSITLDRSADRRARDQDEFARHMERAVTLNRVGLVTVGVAGVLVAAGVIRYAVVGARGRRPRNAVGRLLRGTFWVNHRFRGTGAIAP